MLPVRVGITCERERCFLHKANLCLLQDLCCVGTNSKLVEPGHDNLTRAFDGMVVMAVSCLNKQQSSISNMLFQLVTSSWISLCSGKFQAFCFCCSSVMATQLCSTIFLAWNNCCDVQASMYTNLQCAQISVFRWQDCPNNIPGMVSVVAADNLLSNFHSAVTDHSSSTRI